MEEGNCVTLLNLSPRPPRALNSPRRLNAMKYFIIGWLCVHAAFLRGISHLINVPLTPCLCEMFEMYENTTRLNVMGRRSR